MRYFIPASERQGSCYFEFQPGRWRGRCWLPGSILLADERWEALRLTELFGGFDPEEASAAGAMARCDTPVLFLHGEDDRFVPCAMGRENYACCRAADKTLLTFPAAGHGMSYMADRERYRRYGFPGEGAWRKTLVSRANNRE